MSTTWLPLRSEAPRAERRRAGRRGVEVRCEAVAEDGFRLVGRRAVDVSADGMLLEAEGAPLSVGDEVIVAFQPPRSRLWVDAVAKVARVASHGALGLSFVSMDALDRAILDAKIRALPPRAPERMDYAAAVRAIAQS